MEHYELKKTILNDIHRYRTPLSVLADKYDHSLLHIVMPDIIAQLFSDHLMETADDPDQAQLTAKGLKFIASPDEQSWITGSQHYVYTDTGEWEEMHEDDINTEEDYVPAPPAAKGRSFGTFVIIAAFLHIAALLLHAVMKEDTPIPTTTQFGITPEMARWADSVQAHSDTSLLPYVSP